MQTRFVSLRVTETWEMVQGRTASSTAPTVAALAPREVDPGPAEPQPGELDPAARPKPLPVD